MLTKSIKRPCSKQKMSKRRLSSHEGNIGVAKRPNVSAELPASEDVAMGPKRQHQQGEQQNLLDVSPSMKFRKRSSGGGQRWEISHVNMRDPLNLSSVKPDDPDNPEFAKPIRVRPVNLSDPLDLQNVPASNEQQQRKRKRNRLTKDGGDDGPETEEEKQQIVYPSPLVPKKKFVTAKHKERQQQSAEEQQEKEERCVKEVSECAAGPSSITMATVGADQQSAESCRQRQQLMRERYRYGNFNYYHLKKQIRFSAQFGGATAADTTLQEDPRVGFFCPDWFSDKSVLDIGCSAGRFTITLARAYQPRRIVGVDLDQHLVGAARKNIRHFCDKDTKLVGKFPASFEANFGPVSTPSTSTGPRFPDNIWFRCENYVLGKDAELEKVREEYDIVFALACTKWVHLNWGDAGIKRFFHRAFRQLRTGGRFVLETAPFKDYKKHCNKKGAARPPDEVCRTLEEIRFYPDAFTDFLLHVVGFSHQEELDNPHSKALGISGRLQVFYKGRFMLVGDESANAECFEVRRDGGGKRAEEHQPLV